MIPSDYATTWVGPINYGLGIDSWARPMNSDAGTNAWARGNGFLNEQKLNKDALTFGNDIRHQML